MDPLRDSQQAPPTGYCMRCEAELYEYDNGPLCPECERRSNERQVEEGH